MTAIYSYSRRRRRFLTARRPRNHNLEAQARALYKSWFIDYDPFRDGQFVDSAYGMIPEGWESGVLSDVATIVMGQSPAGASFNEKGQGAVFFQGRSEFGFRYPSERLFTTAPTRFANQYSVLLSVRAPVGDINIAKERCCIGRGLASISGRFQSFVFYTLDALKPVLKSYNGEGTVFGSINRKDLEGLPIVVPPLEIQEQFHRIVLSIDTDIYRINKENERLVYLRDSLLPKLISGEVPILM